MTDLEQAAREWEAYAEGKERMADWDQKMGISDGAVQRRNAEIARRCAQSLRIQEATGIWHCTCCLKPAGTCDGLRRKS